MSSWQAAGDLLMGYAARATLPTHSPTSSENAEQSATVYIDILSPISKYASKTPRELGNSFWRRVGENPTSTLRRLPSADGYERALGAGLPTSPNVSPEGLPASAVRVGDLGRPPVGCSAGSGNPRTTRVLSLTTIPVIPKEPKRLRDLVSSSVRAVIW